VGGDLCIGSRVSFPLVTGYLIAAQTPLPVVIAGNKEVYLQVFLNCSAPSFSPRTDAPGFRDVLAGLLMCRVFALFIPFFTLNLGPGHFFRLRSSHEKALFPLNGYPPSPPSFPPSGDSYDGFPHPLLSTLVPASPKLTPLTPLLRIKSQRRGLLLDVFSFVGSFDFFSPVTINVFLPLEFLGQFSTSCLPLSAFPYV